MMEFIKVMRALSDPNRVKLLKLLEKREEDLCRLTEPSVPLLGRRYRSECTM